MHIIVEVLSYRQERVWFGVFFVVSKEGDGVRKGIFPACMSYFGLSWIPVVQFVVQFLGKQSPVGRGRVAGGQGW